MLQDYLILALDDTRDYWVVDSGASCHATPHRKFFYDYVTSDLDIFYWGMMNHVKLLERVRYGLS